MSPELKHWWYWWFNILTPAPFLLLSFDNARTSNTGHLSER
jgi:hypothetical protein